MELRLHASKGYDDVKLFASTTIQVYNDESESLNRKNGVVHNYKFIESEDYLCLRIDTGSAGIAIIKKVLKGLAKITDIKKVEVDI